MESRQSGGRDCCVERDRNNLVWIDLEMTGLSVETSTIIEIAIVITDAELRELGRWPAGALGQAICQPESILAGMDDWGKRAHARTGLLERVRESSFDLAAAQRHALEFVRRYCPEPGADRSKGCPLAGNSIGIDRTFLQAYMPDLERHTSYRNVDVSTIKELVNRWYPHCSYDKPEAGRHTAMADILASIEELRYYRSKVFKSDGLIPVPSGRAENAGA
ncbi:MAG: oligoribonuclease [Syntrophobacteraceae bacterium]|nr:oligoribonuclease [Syntrophobacteraceae bacterium]